MKLIIENRTGLPVAKALVCIGTALTPWYADGDERSDRYLVTLNNGVQVSAKRNLSSDTAILTMQKKRTVGNEAATG